MQKKLSIEFFSSIKKKSKKNPSMNYKKKDEKKNYHIGL